jgi:hypothetical protein
LPVNETGLFTAERAENAEEHSSCSLGVPGVPGDLGGNCFGFA